MSNAPVSPSPESTLAAGALLTAIGGYLDAYTYVGHGVLANTQSGNVVLAAVAVANAHWPTAIKHVPPIVAFFFGTYLARLMQAIGPRYGFTPVSVSLVVETVILLVNAFLPNSTWEYVTTVSIAFAAALQWSALATAGGLAYTSVATSGNLRQLASSVSALNFGADDSNARSRARAFATFCIGFPAGASVGAVATRVVGHAAAVLPALCLIGLLVTVTVASRTRVQA